MVEIMELVIRATVEPESREPRATLPETQEGEAESWRERLKEEILAEVRRDFGLSGAGQRRR